MLLLLAVLVTEAEVQTALMWVVWPAFGPTRPKRPPRPPSPETVPVA